jgi:hypothetical protein
LIQTNSPQPAPVPTSPALLRTPSLRGSKARGEPILRRAQKGHSNMTTINTPSKVATDRQRLASLQKSAAADEPGSAANVGGADPAKKNWRNLGTKVGRSGR